MMEDPEVREAVERAQEDPTSIISVMSKPVVQAAMQDPAMQQMMREDPAWRKMMQDPRVVQELSKQVSQQALSEEEALQVRQMLSNQLGVPIGEVDSYLSDMDKKDITKEQRDVLELFKNMLSGEEGAAPAPAAPEVADATTTITPPAFTTTITPPAATTNSSPAADAPATSA
jgi:hypothetical protein